MKKRVASLVAGFLVGLLCISQSVYAQQYTVSGTVINGADNTPMAYTNVSLFQGESLVTGSVTADDGSFNLQVKPGDYTLRIQFVSYKTINKPVSVNNASVKLGEVVLEEDVDQLSEVVVQGQKAQMEMKLDKRVFNVGEDLGNIGGSAESILDNLPSVTVDVEGGISLRGSENVRILINGKPSGLVGIDGGSALRQIQADLIERVEVITNPSARYQAEGNAGIINIILKKEKNSGLNGSFQLNGGYPANYGASANLNFRKDWINFFGSYGVRYGENNGGGYNDQTFYQRAIEDGPITDTSYTYIDRDRQREDLSHNLRLGSDFYLNETDIITAAFLYRVSDENNLSYNYYNDYNGNRELLERSVRTQDELEDEEVLEYSVNYKKVFNENDNHTLNLNFQYRDNREIEDADQVEEVLNTTDETFPDDIFQRSYNDEFEQNILAEANYVHPFGKDGKQKFETGWRTNLREINNDYTVEEQDSEGGWQELDDYTNEFNYQEDIHAFYGIYSQEFERLSFQGGVRAEYTNIVTNLVTRDSVNERSYLNFFPSVFFTYDLDKINSLQLSYSRRLDRPRFRNLNPFYTFNDDRNIRAGNPNLNPEFTDSFEFGLLNNLPSASIYSGVYFRYTDGVTDRVSYLEDSITYSIPQNLNFRNSIGLENTYSQDLTDWWKVNANLNIFYSKTEGSYEGEDLSVEAFTLSTRVTSKMTFWDDFDVQVSGRYRAPQQRSQGRSKAFYVIDLGLNKTILNDRGNIALSVSDLFNTRKWRSITEGDNFYYDSEFQWRARTIRFTFDYRLKGAKRKQERERGDGDFGDSGDGY